jgi:anaphase-promoting complex subunit 2
MLVSIYGSKEVFVNEYRVMLADKLLANLDYNTDKEVHTLELLKLRFGELSMRNCEVMIKDIEDSKRANTIIHEALESPSAIRRTTGGPRVTDAVMVSHVFWPSLQNDQLKHHPRIQAELDQFSTEYARLKNPRKLIWHDQLGSVQIELDILEMADGVPVVETKEFTCTPLLATIISHFEDKSRWTLDELSNETGIPEHVLQKKIAFWVNNRVLRQVPGNSSAFDLTTLAHLQQGDNDADMMDEDVHEGHAVSVSAQEEDEMELFESYIVGMLKNMQQLPLDRIHNMLKMFVAGSDFKYDKTPQQLSAFLQHLCKQEKLECGPDGMYKLAKK